MGVRLLVVGIPQSSSTVVPGADLLWVDLLEEVCLRWVPGCRAGWRGGGRCLPPVLAILRDVRWVHRIEHQVFDAWLHCSSVLLPLSRSCPLVVYEPELVAGPRSSGWRHF